MRMPTLQCLMRDPGTTHSVVWFTFPVILLVVLVYSKGVVLPADRRYDLRICSNPLKA
jgi:hypothetical protein